MGLGEYNRKRDFTLTNEPQENHNSESDRLSFVTQKHDASSLHYDFRLEMDGVLKSWAIPKGPSQDPKVKHLAMMVEDHPLDYRNFEGVIPQGLYGAGAVIIWDQGWYETIDDIAGKKLQQDYLLSELEKGSVKVRLHGSKVKGEFALVKTKGMGPNAWLLIKHNDVYASTMDILQSDHSVLTGITIEEMEHAAGLPVRKK